MTIIHVTDSEGEQHEVEAQVGLPIMESLRDLDNGTLALCGGMCSCDDQAIPSSKNPFG